MSVDTQNTKILACLVINRYVTDAVRLSFVAHLREIFVLSSMLWLDIRKNWSYECIVLQNMF